MKAARAESVTDQAEPSAPLAYAEVAIPLRVMQTFTYRLSPSIAERAQVGSRLVVPFGTKLITGYIVRLLQEVETDLEVQAPQIKDAEELLDEEPPLTEEVFELTRWVSDYYAAPWGEVIKAALPAGLNITFRRMISITGAGQEALNKMKGSQALSQKAAVMRQLQRDGSLNINSLATELGRERTLRAVRELEKAGWVNSEVYSERGPAREKTRKSVRLLISQTEQLKLTKTQTKLVEALQSSGGEMLLAELQEETRVSAAPIKNLSRAGVIEIAEKSQWRDPLSNAALPELEEFQLTTAQSAALSQIESQLKAREYGAFLLHGVTSSGKTEVYIRAMRTALQQGRSAMMLVPEIALTPVFSRRLRAHFGDRVAIFHSSLTIGERFDEWSRLKTGEARVVIGTRSAVFAPVSNPGLIVVDEEHDTSYRQHESPFYNARDTAIMRARNNGAVALLGSATPSLESFYNSQTGKYTYLKLPHRIGNRPMARAEIIDMREVFQVKKKPEVFSDELLEAIEDTHHRGEQTIILLNLRGYSSFVLCRSCGETIRCPNCDVTLTFHRSENSLLCHYCNHRRPAPKICPHCESRYIYYIGEGTEQVQDLLQKQFRSLRIARLDRDTATRQKQYDRLIMKFAARELDMLVGTQILAKGHDFPNVTLVGVISVDVGLALPDFRASERTFQLITQVAGRAGRGDRAGRVLIQTYHPEHYALRHAALQDYLGFYKEEIEFRRALAYPPFVALASLLTHHADLMRARDIAAQLRASLDTANSDRACRVLGPAPAPLSRLRGEHRIQLLLKSRNRKAMRRVIDIAMANAVDRGIDPKSINLEIDPVNLM